MLLDIQKHIPMYYKIMGACLVVSLLCFACGSTEKTSEKQTEGVAGNGPKPIDEAETKAFVEDFNRWFVKENAYVQSTFNAAEEKVELEEGGEWDGWVEFDQKTLNAATRASLAPERSPFIAPPLRKALLATLDQADQAGTEYGLGTLLFNNAYVQNSYGTLTSTIHLQSKQPEKLDDGISYRVRTDVVHMFGGSSWPGELVLTVQRTGDGIQLVASKYMN
ncbi:MAG: hypothetical protein AAF570_24850 [Bacteroidota bacterium]